MRKGQTTSRVDEPPQRAAESEVVERTAPNHSDWRSALRVTIAANREDCLRRDQFDPKFYDFLIM